MFKDVFRNLSDNHDGALCKNSYRIKTDNYFLKKAPSLIFHRVPNTPLLCTLYVSPDFPELSKHELSYQGNFLHRFQRQGTLYSPYKAVW